MLQLLGFLNFFFATVPWHSFVPILPSSLFFQSFHPLFSSNLSILSFPSPSILSFLPILPSSLFFQSFHPLFCPNPSILSSNPSILSLLPVLPSSLFFSNPSILSFLPVFPSSLFFQPFHPLFSSNPSILSLNFQSFHPVFSSSPSIVPFVPIFHPLFLPVLLSPQSFRLFSSSPTTLSFLPSLLSGLSSVHPFLIFLHVPLLQPSFHCSDDPALCRTSYSQVCGRPPEDYCCLDPPVMGRLCWWASLFWQPFLLFWK